MISRRTSALLAASLAGALGAMPAAADINWTGDPVTGVTPDPSSTVAGDTIYVGKTTDGSVVVDGGSDVVGFFTFVADGGSTTGAVTVDGVGTTWTSGFSVGRSGVGTLDITGGGSVLGNLWIGDLAGSTGTVTVDGAGSSFDGYVNMVGRDGDGSLSITNGAEVISDSTGGTRVGFETGSTGSITVSGSGSSFVNDDYLQIGTRGTGSLLVTGGATVSNTGRGQLGSQAGGYGEATVSGTGSTWTNGSTLAIGDYGGGSLEILSGGVVLSQTGYIGSSLNTEGPLSYGSVKIDGAGSKWDTGGYFLYVGNNGDGTLEITNRGKLYNSFGTIGEGSGTTGSVLVDGVGSKWTNSGSLKVGNHGDGTLTIQNGGSVENTTGSIANWIGSTGVVTLSGAGSSWTNNGSLYVGNVGHGTLTVGGRSNLFVQGTLWLADNEVGNESVGILNIGDGKAAPDTFDANIISGGGGAATVNVNHLTDGFVLGSDITGFLVLNHDGPGRTVFTGQLSHTGHTFINDGVVQLGDGGTQGNILGNVTNEAELRINRSDTMAYAAQISGDGVTVIESGRLQVGTGGSGGEVLQDIVNNGELAFFNSTDVTHSNVISGSGDFYKFGGNTLTLDALNTYQGITVIGGGTLAIDGELAFGGGTVTINSGATLAGTGIIGRDILVAAGGSLSTGLTILGTVTLDGESIDVGDIAGGSFVATAGQQLNIGEASGGTIDATAGTAQVSTLGGSSQLTTGSWGATVDQLNGGTVNVGAGGSVKVIDFTSGTVVLDNNSDLIIESGVIQSGQIVESIPGTAGLRKVGPGTVTLNSAEGFSEGSIWGGTLQLVAVGATGQIPVMYIQNNGRFEVLADISVDTVVLQDPESTYVKELSNNSLDDIGEVVATNTRARLTGGTYSTTVTMTFDREDSSNYLGERLNLEGLDGSTFMLALNASVLPKYADPQDVYLGWYDESDQTWKNAVEGNMGDSNPHYYNMTFEEFIISEGGWNPTTMLGAYGSDLDSAQAWAVVNHNSSFAVQFVPEPSTMALLAGMSLITMHRRRRDRAL